jgi:hypothetical protein
MGDGGQDNRYACDDMISIADEPRHHLVIENEFVRVFAVEIAPHDRTLCHHHPHDYLVYVVDIADVVSAPRNEKPRTMLYKSGECEMASAGMVHVVENLKGTPFRNIVIEFLPRFGDLRRGPDPRRKFFVDPVANVEDALLDTQGAMSIIPPHFENEKIAVFRSTVPSAGAVTVWGPAVIASPEGRLAQWTQSGAEVAILNSFKALAWLPASTVGMVRGKGVQAVVFQLGDNGKPSSSILNEPEPLKSPRAQGEDPE